MRKLISPAISTRHRTLGIIMLGAVALVTLANAVWGLRNIESLVAAHEAMEHAHQTGDAIDELLSTLQDAETGQRGYLLADDARYLEPYHRAVQRLPERMVWLREQLRDEPEQQARLDDLEKIISEKKAELAQSLQLVDAGQREAAVALLKTGRGLNLMQSARDKVAAMRKAEIELRAQRTGRARSVEALAQFASVFGAVIGIALIFTVAFLLRRDLNLRADAARHLRAQRDWLHTTLHSIGDAVVVTDETGRIVLLNPVAENLLERPAAKVVGLPITDVFDLVDETSGEPIRDPVTLSLSDARKVPPRGAAVLRTPSGAEHAIEDSAALSIDAHGAIQGAIMVFRDVTERRRAELALHTATDALATRNSSALANERILETILENAPIGIFMTGPAPDFRIVAMSRVTREWIGDQTNHVPADAAYHKILPNGSFPAPGQLPLHRAMRAGIAVHGETWIISRQNGAPLRVLVDVAPIRDENHNIVGAVHCWMDLSERERLDRALRITETRLGVLLHSNVIGLILNFRRDGTVVDCNSALLDMLGISRRDLKNGNVNLLDLTPHEFRGKDEKIFRRLDRDVFCQPFEKELLRKDTGERISVVVGYAAIAGSKDEYVGFVLDVTERKELEYRLRQRTEDLLIADRRKDHFLAMLAHELRNPLGSLRNSVYLLEARAGDQSKHDALPAMRRQLDHLVRMVDDLLDVARISQDKITLKKEVVDLRDVMQAAVEIVSPQIETSAHRLHMRKDTEPHYVMGDHIRLVQMVANVLHNAAKYTPVGGEIHLNLDRADGNAIVTVRDNGQGIAADLLPHIFDAFIQADQSLARTAGGLGVGLAVVHKLTELHGGKVQARSGGLNQGSEFEMRLPLIEATEMPKEQPANENDMTKTRRARRVLVVDDNADLAASTSALLELWGHRTQAAHSGKAALEVMTEFLPDLILLDIGLPGLDGFEVAKIIRTEPGNAAIRLIAVSGYGQPVDRERAKQAGFDHYLVKPLRPSVLRSLVEDDTPPA